MSASAAQEPALRLGVDLGGTKTEAVVLRLLGGAAPELEELEILGRVRVPTGREGGYEHVLRTVAGVIREVAQQAGLRELPLPPDDRPRRQRRFAIGVGMPGSVTREGLVKNSNTTCLNGRPFRQDLAALLQQEVAFANDANCFALAEARCGAARGRQVVFGVILGTGVGGGVVFAGPDGPRIWDGAQGIAGEWGHVVLDPAGPPCYCGRRGCIERYLSGPAIEAAYAARAGTELPVREIAQRARAGDKWAALTLDETMAFFGRALATVINILDPDALVLGGGVSNLDLLYQAAPEAVRRWVFNDELRTEILRHELGDSAGVIGAALL